MAVNANSAGRKASDEATEWLVLLQEMPDDADTRRRFQAWLAKSPLNAEAWAATERLGGMIASASPASLSKPIESPTRSETAPTVGKFRSIVLKPHVLWSSPKSRIAAGVFAAALLWLGISMAPDLIVAVQASASSGSGEIRHVALEDGSAIVLAPESAVAVKYTGQERHVALLKGEAFFEVVHNERYPFRVSIGDVEAIDLGTSFNIRRGKRDVSIGVEDGLVRVDRGGSAPLSEELAAGDIIKVARNGDAARSVTSTSHIAGWRRGLIVAQDQPMRDVVDQLRPFFAGKIIVTNQKLAALPVTGVYNVADPENALSAIVQAHGGQIWRFSPWLLVVSSND